MPRYKLNAKALKIVIALIVLIATCLILSPRISSCLSFYLPQSKIKQLDNEAEDGNITAFESIVAYYVFCPICKSDIDHTLDLYKKYKFTNSGATILLRKVVETWDGLGTSEQEIVKNLEKISNKNNNARIVLSEIYKYDRGEEFGDNNNLPKSLYYSKLEGCDTNKEYSYASYLHALFYNYPDNKEYVKVAYAMLIFTKFNANKFYHYSKFDALEENMTSRLDHKEIDYVISNYQSIIAKECEGILADHSQVPTEEKLNLYAFPLKSD